LNTGKEDYSRFVKISIVLLLLAVSVLGEPKALWLGWAVMGLLFAEHWRDQKQYHRAGLLLFLAGALVNASFYQNGSSTASNAFMLIVANYGWRVWDWWKTHRHTMEATDGTR
jgi:hypothetical protein